MTPLPYFLLLLMTSFSARGQECEVGSIPKVDMRSYPVAGAQFGVPPTWKVQQQQFSSGVHLVDEVSGCRLEVASISGMSMAEVVMLHERLYWGNNGLAEVCRATLAKAAGLSPGTVHFGGYEPRMFGYKHLVMVRALSETQTELVGLRCPRNKPVWLKWALLVALGQSLSWK